MAVSSPPASSPRRKGPRWIDVQEQLTGFLFVLPALILVSLFGLFPIGYAFYMSLRRWRVVDRGFIGFANYDKAIGDWLGLALFIGGFAVWLAAYFIWTRFFEHRSGRNLPTVALWIGSFLIGAALVGMGWGRMVHAGDDDFLNSLPITFFYAVGSVPIQLALALVLAYILFQQIKGREFFRMAYFLPYVTPVIATALVFRVIFSPRPTSIANRFLELFGIAPQKWLFEPTPILHLITGNDAIQGFWAGPSLALVSIIFFGIWTYVGYNTVIFLAGLGNIPDTLYEAAEIDGATDWELFRHITVPLLSPVTFYLSLIGFIGTFKAFNHIYVMQQPSALGTVETASVAIFNTFYKASQFGYATAQAMLLFGIILFLTFVQNQIFGKRVFYG